MPSFAMGTCGVCGQRCLLTPERLARIHAIGGRGCPGGLAPVTQIELNGLDEVSPSVDVPSFDAATLLFLHGVGQQRDDQAWMVGLEGALVDLGYPSPDLLEVTSPNYLDLLSAAPPPRSAGTPRTDRLGDSLVLRGQYEVSQASMRRLLGVTEDADPARGVFAGIPAGLAEAGVDVATRWCEDLRQAGKYMREDGLQAAVMTRVLEYLPKTAKRLVIVGHSLGSLVAIDLLEHLPAGITVSRLITIGSPAGLRIFHERSERLLRKFPYGRVHSWLNVVSPRDAVTSGRGLTWLFPAAHDLRVDLPAFEHSAAAYLRQEKVALAVGEALFGSLHRELTMLQHELEVAPTEAESQILFGIAFAHMTLHKLRDTDPDRAPRYEQALVSVQVAVADRLRTVAQEQGRAVSTVVESLIDGRQPPCPRIWTPEQSVTLMIVAATTNLVSPWEIQANKPSREALELAAVGLGLGAQQGSKISEALTSARSGLGIAEGPSWDRVLLGAAGIAILVAGPVGLLVAAPAGLAGAAAVTSALAAFGPGGMVGGMALAGTLVGTGAVTAASALLAQSSAVVLETEVLRRCAHAYALDLLGLDQDQSDWLLLTAMESSLAAETAQLSAFSDADSPRLKTLVAKARFVRRAIDWLLSLGLGQSALEAPAGQVHTHRG